VDLNTFLAERRSGAVLWHEHWVRCLDYFVCCHDDDQVKNELYMHYFFAWHWSSLLISHCLPLFPNLIVTGICMPLLLDNVLNDSNDYFQHFFNIILPENEDNCDAKHDIALNLGDSQPVKFAVRLKQQMISVVQSVCTGGSGKLPLLLLRKVY